MPVSFREGQTPTGGSGKIKILFIAAKGLRCRAPRRFCSESGVVYKNESNPTHFGPQDEY